MLDRIRVGVVLDSFDVPAWQFAALESITCDCAAITRVIVCGSSHSVAREPRGLVSRWLHRVVRRLEAGRRKPGPDACQPVSAAGLLHAVTRLEHACDDDIDVLIHFSDQEATSAELPPARLGHWYFTNSGCPFEPSSGVSVGLAEFVRRRDSLETTLVVHDPRRRCDLAAYGTRSAIDYFSHYVTRNEHLWKCSAIVLRALRACHAAGGCDYLSSLPVTTGHRRGTDGGLALALAFVPYLMWRAWKKAHRSLFAERWVLMAAIDEGAVGEGSYTTLLPPNDRFWADPHVVENDGRHHVFFEDASRETGMGHISVMSDDGHGRFNAPQSILKRPYHLSYPFVFRWDGSWFLLPESAQNRTVELYRSTRFPDQWEPSHVLLEDIEAYDSTLLEHGGRWWLFANVRERSGASTWDELHVFHAESPVSRDWHAHCFNPVVSDVRRARPAGRFYMEGGRLFRPSQNSSRRYGHALVINEVIELNESRYEERTVREVGPRWHRGVAAIHSYSRAGRLTLIDAIRRDRRGAEVH